MNEKRISFDEIPGIMQGILTEMQTLSQKVQTLSDKQDEQNRIVSGKLGHKPMATDEVCEYLHKTKVAVYKMVANTDIPHYKEGKRLLFYEDELAKWLREQPKKSSTSNMDAAARDYAQEYCAANPI